MCSNNWIKISIAVFISFLLYSCSDNRDFVVRGTVEGIGMQTIVMTYYADGGIRRLNVAADNGKFMFRGSSAVPTLAVVELSDGTELATVVVKNGDKLKIEADKANPLATKVSGNGESASLARWTSGNADVIASGDASAINRSIADFVSSHKSDIASTAMLVSKFRTQGYEVLADSLFTLIDIDARPAAVVQNFSAVLAVQLNRKGSAEVLPMTLRDNNDSTYYFRPAAQTVALLAFVGNKAGRDSITDPMRSLTERYPTKRFVAVEISTAADSASWSDCIRNDSATWHQAWAPGSVAAAAIYKLAVPQLPYFIVSDSAGVQLYRGASVSAAVKTVENRLK